MTPSRRHTYQGSYSEVSDDGSADDSGDYSVAGTADTGPPAAARASQARAAAALESLLGPGDAVEADYCGDGIWYPAEVIKITPPIVSPLSTDRSRFAHATMYDIKYTDGDVQRNLLREVKSYDTGEN